jgi:hypothetical protein
LLAAGAKPDAMNQQRMTPLDLAHASPMVSLVQLFVLIQEHQRQIKSVSTSLNNNTVGGMHSSAPKGGLRGSVILQTSQLQSLPQQQQQGVGLATGPPPTTPLPALPTGQLPIPTPNAMPTPNATSNSNVNSISGPLSQAQLNEICLITVEHV